MQDFTEIIDTEYGSYRERLDSLYAASVEWLWFLDDCVHGDNDFMTPDNARLVLVNFAHVISHILGECASQE